MRNAYEIPVGRLEGKGHVGNLGTGCTIKMGLIEMTCDSVDWIRVVQDRVQEREPSGSIKGESFYQHNNYQLLKHD
jgi:hypothetical protein